MAANIPEEGRADTSLRAAGRAAAILRLPVLLSALAYFTISVFETNGDSAVSTGSVAYWLPNALLLAALLLNAPSKTTVLLMVSVAHILPLLGSGISAERIVSSLLCNEGFVLCAAVVLWTVLDQRTASRCWIPLDNVMTTRALGPALLLVGVVATLSVLSNTASILPAAGPLIEQCVAACALESIVAFATVTPAVVCWSKIACTPTASPRHAEVVLAASMAGLVCVSAELHGGVIAMTLLCLLPIIALWAALCLGAAALTGCLLVSMLTLQFLAGQSPGGAVGHEMSLFVFATAAGSLVVMELRVWYRARLDLASSRLAQVMKRARSARARFRSRRQRQKLMLKASHSAVFCWDLRRDSLWWNARAESYLGETSRIRAGWLIWNDCIDAAERASIVADLRRFLASRDTYWRSEFTIRTPDALAVAVGCRAFLLRDEFGKPLQMIGALADMSDAHTAKESSRALSRATRLAAIGEISATITHEVNQPLAAILNNAETALYLMKMGRGSPDVLEQILEDIRRDDLRASAVVRRTRTLLQDRELVRQPVDLNDVVVDAVRLLSETARRRDIDVVVTLSKLDLVQADALHLQQVMINLLGNAFDAVEKASSDHKRVEVRTHASAGYAQVCVKDLGCGIPESDLERIFEAFRTGKAEGLGLGLSLARFIVTAHSGRIFAENNSCGRGATIRFELPVAVLREAERDVISLP